MVPSQATGASSASTARSHTLDVRLEERQAVLDGKAYSLANDEAAILLVALSANPGNWVSPKDIISNYPDYEGARTTRVIQSLPKPISNLVKTERGRGARILL
jgi:DNA-binding response OmpR family regulator